MIEAKYLWSQKNLYFLGLYKSLCVVSKFMDLNWCRREKNQIPPRSAWTNIEFGLITFFVFKFLSHKLSSDPPAWFSILLENEYFENPENQPKWLASLLILNELLKKNGCNQNLCLVEPIVMVYFIFDEDQV